MANCNITYAVGSAGWLMDKILDRSVRISLDSGKDCQRLVVMHKSEFTSVIAVLGEIHQNAILEDIRYVVHGHTTYNDCSGVVWSLAAQLFLFEFANEWFSIRKQTEMKGVE